MSGREQNDLDFLDSYLGNVDGSRKTEVPGTRPDLADRMQVEEQLLARLASLVPAIDPPDDLLDAIEAKIDALPSDPIRTVRSDEGEWVKRSDKIWMKVLHTDDRINTSMYLLRCEPGAILTAHKHERDEHVFVIEGEFRIGESILKAGDFQFSHAGSVHPKITTDTGCLVMVRC